LSLFRAGKLGDRPGEVLYPGQAIFVAVAAPYGVGVRWIALSTLVALVVTAGAVAAAAEKTFPRVRAGVGNEPTSGGGVVNGDRYVPRSAVIAWNRHWGSLTLYLLPRAGVACRTLPAATQKPGHLIQVYVTSKPRVRVGRRMADPQVAFVTAYRDKPMDVAAALHVARLTFTRVDTYPGGVWHGTFDVPHTKYANGKVYGYHGTFAARWCQLRT
jgi:hypothetical protein